MFIRILTAIGVYLLYLLSGYNVANGMCHLLLSTYPAKHLAGLHNAFFSTHIGNTIAGLSFLSAGFLILLLLKYEFKLNLNTLFVFLGFGLNFVLLSLFFDTSFFGTGR